MEAERPADCRCVDLHPKFLGQSCARSEREYCDTATPDARRSTSAIAAKLRVLGIGERRAHGCTTESSDLTPRSARATCSGTPKISVHAKRRFGVSNTS